MTSPRWPAVVALAAVALLAGACGGDDDGDGSSGGGGGAIEGVVTERVGEYDHLVGDLDYDEPLPSGGDHPPAPGWLNCGVYEGQVPEELAVHSLEHGAVWIGLGPDSTAADRTAATELADLRPGRVIVSDVPDLANPVEIVAWGFRLVLDSAEDERAAEFVEAYADAPTAPEAGAACSQALGAPPTPPVYP